LKIREYESAGGVIINDDRVLLLDRPSRDEVRLPKGHIDPGETPQETALREVQEETGLASLAILDDLGSRVVEFDYKNAHYQRTEYYFLMRRIGEETFDRPPKDARDFHPIWVHIDEAVDRLTYEAEQDAAQRAITAHRERTEDTPRTD
jgi:8-oxo-dGTP pyrophosphatase MutT (NUDIX family)